jgi:membrane protease YdiL (CAAX protease family)
MSSEAGAKDACAATLQVVLLVLGLSCAVALRWLASGTRGVQSPTGGLVFAGSLAALSGAAGLSIPRRLTVSVLSGTPAGLMLAGVALLRLGLPTSPAGGLDRFLPWIAVAATVAVSEEAFLRGVLFDLILRLHSESGAVIVGAGVFAGLHVPLYGWQVLPLDFAVGLLLGTLRLLTGSWVSPAVAHVLADAAGWWVR